MPEELLAVRAKPDRRRALEDLPVILRAPSRLDLERTQHTIEIDDCRRPAELFASRYERPARVLHDVRRFEHREAHALRHIAIKHNAVAPKLLRAPDKRLVPHHQPERVLREMPRQ